MFYWTSFHFTTMNDAYTDIQYKVGMLESRKMKNNGIWN